MENGETMELMRKRLREAREERGLTQKQLGELIEANKGAVMALENMSIMRAVNLDVLCDICDALDISIDWLFGRCSNQRGYDMSTVVQIPMVAKFFNPRWNEDGKIPYVEQHLEMTEPMLK